MERDRIELGRTESDIYCGGTDGGEARWWNIQRRGAEERSNGGTEDKCDGRAEKILAAAMDGGVIGVDDGRWRDRRRWWTVA